MKKVDPVEVSWMEVLRGFRDPRVITMLFLGFAAGLPLLLIFSSLSVWLREAGVNRSVVTYFSWAALGYSFKFVWAPLVDSLRIPVLAKRLGHRRSWLLVSQLAIILAIVFMSSSDPSEGVNALTFLAVGAVLLGFSSATQDIVIDAYRIESAGSRLQAMLSSAYIGGYRIGLLVAGAGGLLLASHFGSDAQAYQYAAWQKTYLAMAGFMLIGVMTTLMAREPDTKRPKLEIHSIQILFLFVVCVAVFIASYASLGLLSQIKPLLTDWFGNAVLAGVLVEFGKLLAAIFATAVVASLLIKMGLVAYPVVNQLYVAPVQNFFQRYGLKTALWVLLFIGLYRISDIVLGVISNVFYYDLGFTKNEIAGVVKSFGLIMTLVGGFAGGALCIRFGVMRVLIAGGILSAVTNLLFVVLAGMGNEMWFLYVVISADNLSAGLATAAFVAFLSALTHIQFTAMQYAIFSSLMTLLPKIIGGYSGSMVDALGYAYFFMGTAAMGVPVIVLMFYLRNRINLATEEGQSS